MTQAVTTRFEETPEQLIGDLIVHMIADRFGQDGEELYDVLQPLLTILVRVGVEQSLDAAEGMLDGIASDQPYAAWRGIIESATVEERIVVMEAARQAAIADRVKQLKSIAAWQSVGKTIIQVAISAAGLLLM